MINLKMNYLILKLKKRISMNDLFQSWKKIINYRFFKTDKGQTILKVKKKYVKLRELETLKDQTVSVDIRFAYHKMGEVEGFYVNSLI